MCKVIKPQFMFSNDVRGADADSFSMRSVAITAAGSSLAKAFTRISRCPKQRGAGREVAVCGKWKDESAPGWDAVL